VHDPYHLVVEKEPDPHDLALLEELLAAEAIAAVGAGAEQEFGIFVRDDQQTIIAGVSGSIWGGCCQIHVLWVDGEHRRRGLARRLLAEAEAEARRRGCRLVMGITYDVLTSGYYEPLGYQTIGLIEDCPTGTSTRWYRKDL
jgi:GNAT superfamily N-acetyltransferase